jgi:peptidoglycan/LPS O-acetylase OafA/YrhL
MGTWIAAALGPFVPHWTCDVGILRVYLALCVISAHVRPALPWVLHDSKQAVQIFYIISGFYMALVLSQRYATPKPFYVSRFLRIFSAYWIVLLVVGLASVVGKLVFDDWLYLEPFASHPLEKNGATGFIVALISNLTLFGQDWVMFLQHEHGQALGLARNFRLNAHPLLDYLLFPQCWSIGVELSFYAIAPFLNRLKTYDLVLFAAVPLSAHLLAKNYWGLSNDPWSYRFFPFELTWFLAGMLGYRFYRTVVSRFDVARFVSGNWRYAGAAAVLLVLLEVHARTVRVLCQSLDYDKGVILSYFVWPVLIAFAFALFKDQRIDRFVGELSYPIYLVHVAVVAAIRPLFVKWALPNQHLGEATAAISIVLAIVLYVFCLRRIDQKRHGGPPDALTPSVPAELSTAEAG